MAIRGELFTNQVNLDNRSYFFNVKENRNGDIFLQIVESKLRDGAERRDIVVFADDMKEFFKGLDESLTYIDKVKKERAKLRAEKKAAKDARFNPDGAESEKSSKKIYRRKGESRLVAEKKSAKKDDGIKRTGKVIHITSKRSSDSEKTEY